MPDEEKNKPEQPDAPKEPSAEWENPRTPLRPEDATEKTTVINDEPLPSESDPEPGLPPDTQTDDIKVGRWQRLRRWYLSHKKISIPATALLALVFLLAIPPGRYAVAGLFINHDIQVRVIDSETGAPVSDAFVSASSGQPGTTDGTGTAVLANVGPGQTTVTVSKKYYNDGSASITVGVINPKEPYELSMKASGRAANLKVTDRINGDNLPGVEIAVADIKAKTDESGEALVVLPPGTASFDATLNKGGYNETKVAIKVSDSGLEQNDLKMTPSGQIYFLSNRSGGIDVMKANLDGSDAKVVLAATGQENENNTMLIASPDWEHLALLARREGKYPKVYIIKTSDDRLSTVDEGNSEFTLSGWLGDKLIYSENRKDIKPWQTGSGRLKSYDAETGKITTLNQTTGKGDVNSNIYEYYRFIYLHGDDVVFAKGWTVGSEYDTEVDYAGIRETLSSISADGQNYKEVAGYDLVTKAVEYAPHAPNQIYIQVVTLQTEEADEKTDFYNYVIESSPTPVNINYDEFYRSYPAYYPSADGQQLAWMEQRDGKDMIVIGDSNANNSRAMETQEGHWVFGWFGPKYLIMAKDGSELAAVSSSETGEPVKISNYYGASFYAIAGQWYLY